MQQHLLISSSSSSSNTTSSPSSPSPSPNDDDDFIDMDVKTTTFLCSPEFEFMSLPTTASLPIQQQQQQQQQREEEEEGGGGGLAGSSSGYNNKIKYSSSSSSFISPADELFYKGQLLPLHLPPRLQMVQKLHALTTSTCNSINTTNDCGAESKRRLVNSFSSYSTGVTPYESCNVTPSESCQVSGEINPDQYNFFFHHTNGNDNDNVKLPPQTKKMWWSKRIKQSMKASRDYLRSLFGKSAGCSPDDHHQHQHLNYSASAFDSKKNKKDDDLHDQLIIGENSALKKKSGHDSKVIYKKSSNNGFGSHEIIYKVKRGNKSSSIGDLDTGGHRKSFSGAIKAFSTPNKSSSSSSNHSTSSNTSSNSSSSNSTSCVNGIDHGVNLLKRSSSVNSEADVENSIQGAIAYCKQSQLKKEQYSCSDDAADNHQHGFFSNLSAANSKIVSSETQER